MKKLIVCSVFALILVLSGCGKGGVPASSGITDGAETLPAFQFADYQDMPEEFPSEESFGPITDTAALLEKAEALWIRIYGEQIKKQQPYQLSYDEAAGVWLIQGTFPDDPNLLGGVAYMLVENATGDVLAVWHTK